MNTIVRLLLVSGLVCGLGEGLQAAPADQAAEAKPVALDLPGNNRMLDLKISRLQVANHVDRVSAAPDGRLFILQTEWRSRGNIPGTVPALADRFYLVLNGRRLCGLHPLTPQLGEGFLKQIKLEKNGQPTSGALVFEGPAEPLQSLEFCYFDAANGDIAIPLVTGGEADKPAAGPIANPVLELAAFGRRQGLTWAGRQAPAGMAFMIIDLRGRSLAKTRSGASAFVDLPEWRRYLCLIVDGEYSYSPEPPEPVKQRFLPAALTGHEVAFLVPAKFESLELRLDMPSLEKPAGGKPAQSAAITLPLAGQPPATPDSKIIATASDEMFEVAFVGTRLVSEVAWQTPPPNFKLLETRFAVRNTSQSGQWFQPARQIRFSPKKGGSMGASELSGQCLHPCGQTLWVPAGQRRTAEIIHQIPSAEVDATIEFTSAKAKKTLPLGPIAAQAEDPPVAEVPAAQPAASPPPPATSAQLAAIRMDGTQVFFPDLVPKGLAGVGLTQAEVDKAVVRGRDYLWQQLGGRIDGHQGAKPEILAQLAQKCGQESVLFAYALLHSGAAGAYPEFEPFLRSVFPKSFRFNTLNTYHVGLLAMLADTWRGPGSDRWIWLAGRNFVEAQGVEGCWSYNSRDVRAVTALIDREWPPAAAKPGGMSLYRKLPLNQVANDGDNSCSQFAILALWMAARNGLAPPPEMWQSALLQTRQRQTDDGGWHYNQLERNKPGYGSMTCAGVCTSALCLHHLGCDPLLDPGVQRGLAWLEKNWTVESNPRAGGSHYYYIYSIERVGRILGLDFIGSHEWYPLGARYLVDHQGENGAWRELPPNPKPPPAEASRASAPQYTDPMATAFALLFLTRATESLTPQPDGELVTVAPQAPPPRIYIILDASGSMLNEVDHKAKFEAAREAVAELVRSLPDSIELALRVYGHNTAPGSPKAAEDTVLEIRLGKLDRGAFAAKLDGLHAKGDTPLALSLLQTKTDLEEADISPEKPIVVVVLTDGKEDTKAKRDPVAAAREFSQVKGVKTHVVGFDIRKGAASSELEKLAMTAGGKYWPVDRAGELARQLQKAVGTAVTEFSVVNALGVEAAKGVLGQRVTLSPGRYTLIVRKPDSPELRESITIRPGETTTYGQSGGGAADKPAP